jgi:antitoxin (DNA-binding transcriptional repressor) of toxin-antitoxin stability system
LRAISAAKAGVPINATVAIAVASLIPAPENMANPNIRPARAAVAVSAQRRGKALDSVGRPGLALACARAGSEHLKPP